MFDKFPTFLRTKRGLEYRKDGDSDSDSSSFVLLIFREAIVHPIA